MRAIIFIFLLAGQLQAQSFVLVFLHPREDKPELPKEQVDKLMQGHFANIQRLSSEGKLVVAGPFEEGGGIFIFRSTSFDEVREWLKPDPGIQANRWKIEMVPYKPRYGTPQGGHKPYDYVVYQFIRFTSYIAKFNINDMPQLMKQHDDYLAELKKSGNVVAEGTFNDTDGGILVMKGELNKEVIESDPAVHAGLLEIEIKKWTVARGAFGEK